MPDTNPSDDVLLDAHVVLPQHVVHRSFVQETVVLNLRTGKYHGLNRSAGEMLTAMSEGSTPREAAAKVAELYELSGAELEGDVLALCRGLLERELIQVNVDSAATG